MEQPDLVHVHPKVSFIPKKYRQDSKQGTITMHLQTKTQREIEGISYNQRSL